jgi:hypothetical protein
VDGRACLIMCQNACEGLEPLGWGYLLCVGLCYAVCTESQN